MGRLPARDARRPARGGRRRARLQRLAGAAHAGLLHPRRSRAVGGDVRAFAGLRGRRAGQRGPQRLRLRPVHRRPGHPPGRDRARRDRRADVGRDDRTPDPHDRRPRTRHPDLHALLRRTPRRGGARSGDRAVAEGRPVRLRAVVGGAARPDRGPARAGALDIYGLSEIIGPGVATECLERDGLHVNEDHFIVETLDADGAPVPRAPPASWCSPRPGRRCRCCATAPATSPR